jgi:hypothetical protein
LQGFPAAYTMFVASELLPTHHQRAYKDTATRWSLAAAALRVMLAAVEGGARRRGTSASPDPASPPGSIDDVTVTGLGAWVLRQLLLDGGWVAGSQREKGGVEVQKPFQQDMEGKDAWGSTPPKYCDSDSAALAA